MTVGELIERLQEFGPEQRVMLYDVPGQFRIDIGDVNEVESIIFLETAE